MRIVMHIQAGNPQVVLHPLVRTWCAKRDNLAALVRLAARRDSTVIVMAE
jgi:hypothetical protein